MRLRRPGPARRTARVPVRKRSARSACTLLTCAAVLAGAEPAGGQASSPSRTDALFESHEILEVTLRADLAALRGDRTESPDRRAVVSVVDEGGSPRDVALVVRTRGAFRLDPANCSFPPLRLDFRESDARGTPFAGEGRLKLVASCRPGRESYEQLVLKEYLAYRSYAELTGESFRVRRLRLTLVDSPGDGPVGAPATAGRDDDPALGPRTAFLIEEDHALSARLGGMRYDLEEGRNLPADAFEPVSQLRTALFQYMIGATDWSDVVGHNVEIVDRGGVALAVPYDFDMSGVVDPPYATTNPDLGLTSIRERLYRGWCANPVNTQRVLEAFRRTREAMLDVWEGEPGLAEDVRRRAIGYLESFFDDIATDERAERRILRHCRAPR